jgi:Ca2+-binding RTX toxin-like protein
MDSLIGGNGDDLYIMQNIDDIIVEKVDGGEQDQIIAAVDFNLGQSENVEFLTLTGKKAIEGTGNDLNNLLQEIEGGKINNVFTGNGGNDTINGQGGNDTLEGGNGDDELNGGDGVDVAIFSGIYEDYLITTNVDAEGVAQLIVEYSNPNTDILDGVDILNDIEILEFADGDRHNIKDVLKELDSTETESNAMVILTGVETV